MLVENRLFFAQVEALLSEGEEVQLRIKGHSMRPLLRSDRDTVILVPYRGTALHVHDIVLFRHGGRHILHRIVAIDGERLTIEGDGNYRITEHATTDNVVGIARRIVRPDGRAIDCDSPRWRRLSRCWLALPPLVRRLLLAVSMKITLLWRRCIATRARKA